MRVRQINLRKLWLSLLLLVGATAIAVPGIQEVMDGNVAKIGNTEYATLQAAVNAIPTDGTKVTLTLLQDVTVSSEITIPEGSDVIIDFAGNKMVLAGNWLFLNKGTLILNDSGSGGGITFTSNILGASGGKGCVDNYGTLTVNAGNYETFNTGSGTALYNNPGANMTINDGTVNAAFYALLNDNGNLTIAGGTINSSSCSKCDPSYAYCVSSYGTFTMTNGSINGVQGALSIIGGNGTISGGTVSANTCTRGNHGSNGTYYALYVAGEKTTVSCTVNGGTFSSTGAATVLVGNSGDGGNKENAALVINDGTFKHETGGTVVKVDNTLGNPYIYGGAFIGNVSSITSDYLAEGCTLVDNGNGTYSVQNNSVAQIGETTYTSLVDAFEAVQDGQTITLLADLDFSQAPYADYKWAGSTVNPLAITVDNVTLDLNNHTISNMGNCALGIGSIYAKDGTVSGVTIKNGTLNAGTTNDVVNSYVLLLGGAKNATIQDVTTNGGINVCAESDVNIKGCSVNGTKYYTVCAQTGANVTIGGTTFTKNTDSSVKTKAMFYIQGAGTDEDMITTENPTGAFEASTITIESGDFTVDTTNGGTFFLSGNVAPVVKGGTYNIDPSNFQSTDCVASGYESVDNGNGTWTVQKAAVAKIGETKYYSLADAFEAAQAGQTITVLTDIDLPSTIAVTKQVTLNLDGKTISNTSDLWAGGNWSFFSVRANGNLTVTGNGTIDAKENDCFTFDVRDGGILTIKDGTYTGNISSVYLINEAGTGVSTCNIEGGTFSIKQIDGTGGYNFLLNCLDASYKNNTVKFNVTGGSFVNFNPANNQAEGVATNFCAAGYEAVQNDNVWTVQKAPVAKIDGTTYTSLAEAFEAATEGQTITVLTDIDQPSTINVTKQVTLDLDGKTISNTSDLWAGGNWSFFSVRANGNLTVTGNGTIDAKENDCFTFDVRDGGILTIKDGTYTGNISSVYLINEAGTGVSTCNIEGGTFSIKQLDETGGYNFLLNCLDASYKNNTVKFNVTGGSFVNFNPANNQAEGVATNFCAAGYEAVQDGDVWTVQKAPVAKIGETTYTSLAEAFEAAQAGQTITVLTDIDLPSTIAVTKQVTLDLAGNTIFNTSDLWVDGNWSFFSVQANGNLTVTGEGTIDAKENDCYSFDVRDGGILTIKNGTFTGNISSVYLINEAGKGVSTCNIEGGTFSIKQLANTDSDKYRYLLNCHDASYAENMAKFNVTGGSFVNFNPANNLAEGAETNFCAAGYEAVQDGNVWTVQKAAVAQIEGGAKYETLQAAINACEAGTETTIKLLDNVTDGAGFAIPDGVTNKNIIIDFDGKSYNVTKDAVGSGNTKSQAMHFYSGNTLTLKNGTITSAATSEENKLKMMMQNYCDLTLDGMTIDCSNTNGGTYPDYSSTTYEYWSFKSVPVFNFNTGNATIKNTTITFRDGDNVGLCVDGGTVALGEGVEVNGPVSAVTGTVTITDGKYSGAITADKATIQISGGIFTKKPADEYCAHGFVVTDNKDEETKVQYPYTVMSKEDAGIFELIDRGNDPTTTPYIRKEKVHAQQVTYIRKFSNTNLAPWYVPFDMEITDELASKFTFYKPDMVKGVVDEHGVTTNKDNYLQITEKGVGYVLKANKPYFVKAKQIGEFTFTVTDVDLEPAVTDPGVDCSTTTTTFKFNGNYDFYHNQGNFLLMRNNELQWSNNKYGVYTFRWYVTTVGKENWAKINLMIVENDSEATGVSSVDEVFSDEIEGYYTPNGSKHESPVKGMNIIKFKNGKTKKIMNN